MEEGDGGPGPLVDGRQPHGSPEPHGHGCHVVAGADLRPVPQEVAAVVRQGGEPGHSRSPQEQEGHRQALQPRADRPLDQGARLRRRGRCRG